MLPVLSKSGHRFTCVAVAVTIGISFGVGLVLVLAVALVLGFIFTLIVASPFAVTVVVLENKATLALGIA